MNIAGFVGMTDEETDRPTPCENAQFIARGAQSDRGPFDAEEALTQLLEILDRPDVVVANRPLVSGIWIATIKMRPTQGSHRADFTALVPPSGARDVGCGARTANRPIRSNRTKAPAGARASNGRRSNVRDLLAAPFCKPLPPERRCKRQVAFLGTVGLSKHSPDTANRG